MSDNTKTKAEDREDRDTLTEMLRAGARKLIAQALDAEVAELLGGYADHRDEQDRAIVVRSGHHPEREIQTGIGPAQSRSRRYVVDRGSQSLSVPPSFHLSCARRGVWRAHSPGCI